MRAARGRPAGTLSAASLSAAASLVAVPVLLTAGSPASSDPDGRRGTGGGGTPARFQELPAGVTPETVERGRVLYRGKGLCHVCHGRSGRGVRQAGSSLRDTVWHHSDGSYRSIARRVREGITARASATGIPMPPRGGSEIDDEEVLAVAAYVWWISRGGDPDAPPDGPRRRP